METKLEDRLTRDEERVLLRIARDAMKDCVTRGVLREVETYPLTPLLRETHGAFVTLRCAHHLRGRAGALGGDLSLAQAVRDYTVRAALHNGVYRPIAPNETDDIDVEVTVVLAKTGCAEPCEPIEDPDAIEAGRDGLYLEYAVEPAIGATHAGSRLAQRAGTHGSAVVLPQEARAHGWSRAHCLAELCRKAGAPVRAWEQPGGHLYRFGVQVFSERHHSDYANW